MIGAYLSLDYFYTFPLTQRPQYFSYFRSLFLIKYFSSILWRKYYVILAIPLRMC